MKFISLISAVFILMVSNLCYSSNVMVVNQTFNTPVSYTTYDTVIIKNCTFNNIANNAFTCYNAKYLLIDSCYFSNITLHAIHFRSVKYAIIQNSNFYNIEKGILIGRESQNSFTHSADNAGYRVDSLFMVNNIIKNINSHGVRILNTAFVDFNQNLIDSCLLGGIVLGSNPGVAPCSLFEINPILNAVKSETRINGCYIRNNTILHTLSDGIGTLENVYGSKILNNEIAYVAYDGIGARPLNGDHGMYLQGPDALVEGNHVHHILDDCGSPGCDGVGISFRSTAIINKNVVHHCINSGIAYFNDHPRGLRDIYITNNLVYDNRRTAIYINPGCPESEPDSVHIYHNTVVTQPLQALWQQACPVGFNNYSGYKSVIGNILIYEGVVDSTHYIFNSTGAINNLHNIKSSGDAGFVDFATRDLRLLNLSPAIDLLPASYALVPDDIQGNLRISPADAGAYEYYLPVIVRDTGNVFYPITFTDSSQIYTTVVVENVPGIMDTIVVSSLIVTCDTISTTTTSVVDSTTLTNYDTIFISYVFSIYDSVLIHCVVSNTDSIFIPEIVNRITDAPTYENWAVYPSPGNGYFVIKQNENPFATKATLYDSRGRQVGAVQLSGATSSVDFSSVTTQGIYFLKLQGEVFSTTKRIVIIPH